jgi:signal transduction histidine kinase
MANLQDASNAAERAGGPRAVAENGKARVFGRGFARGLSARLLALTFAAVLVVAALIFTPTVAAFHTQQLQARADAAKLATLAALAAPDLQLSDDLAARLLAEAEVKAVGVKRDGQRELIIGAVAPPQPPIWIDLRKRGLGAAVVDAVRTYFEPDDRFVLIVDDASMEGAEYIEVLVPVAPLKEALYGFTVRVLLLTLLSSAIVGAVIYAALAVLFVRPMRRLALAMSRFREEPEDPTRAIRPSGRADEIGDAEAALAELQAQVRQALRQKARLAALGEAVAKINHDLRNVLTNAQLVSDRLAQSADPQVRAQGERLVRAIDRGVRLAQDVLAFGRAQERAPAAERVALRLLLEEAFLDAASAASMPMGVDLQVTEDQAVVGDEEFLHRVFVNLMRNAVIAVAGQEGRNAPGMITVGAEARDGYLAVAVADDGPGIPERALERLFQPFAASGSANGTGLGLAIARELARAQGGDVELISTGASGTVFEVRLPRA